MSDRNSIFKPTLVLMSGRTLAFAVTFFVPMVLVRIFDQTEFGTYKQLFLIFATLYGIAQLGMAESLFYFLPPASHERGRYVLNSLLVLAGAGLASLGFLTLARWKISLWMNNSELSGYIPWIGIYLLLMMASAVLENVMISRKRYFWASFSYGFSDLLRAILLLVPVLLFRQMEWLLLGAVAFASVRLCVALFYLRYEFGGELRPDTALLNKQLRYALPFQLAVLVETVQWNFHQYAVSYYFDAATFAIYAVGCLQIPLVDCLYTPASNVMMVRMSEEIRDGRSNALLAIWHDTTRKMALVFFPLVGLLLVAASDLIVFLFTESYRGSVPIFMIWSTVILFSTLQTDGVLRVFAETRFILLLNAIRLMFIVASINWFLSAFHLSGAVIVTVIATCIGKGLALVRMKSLLQAGLSQLLPWRGLAGIFIAAAAAGLLALSVESALDIAKLPRLLITSLVYSISYLTVLLRFNLLSEDERLVFAGWWQRFSAGVTKAGALTRS
jgi:O-antigen/teichoic acid export membrane protein